ncbi:MAG TPA: 3-deoxy-D-manno-octulosonate 8-phosphate phosphatase [Candidatus Cloacimonetes bacterium]|nr:3-deoxy-D-manno-octulosonate 8-phosphate phosphatase [Candidatus Cloacimonadota bacterium]
MKDFKKIKLLILDCDGVLTDGKIIYNDNRIEIRNFSAKDGLGIKMLMFAGIEVAVISGKYSETLTKRCEDLGIKHVFQKIRNKLKVAEKLFKELDMSWDNVAYMGDDWNDFPVIKKVSLSAAPNDVMEDFKEKVDFISTRKGGEGAVREFIEFILKKQGIYEKVLLDFISFLENS